jgi:natural product precursor
MKLNQVVGKVLSDKEMSMQKGGKQEGMCGCGCTGSASIMTNGLANADHGYWSGDAFQCIQTVVYTPKE